MKVIGVIPARYASTRFPGKVLAELCGRPMIEWVWQGASEAKLLDEVLIATDEEIVALAARRFGARVEMTRADHESGTDRLGEIAEVHPADYYVNIQGDEPLVRGDAIDSLVSGVASENADMGTLAYPVDVRSDEMKILEQPQCVKVVTDNSGYALYFSRFPIPFPRSIVHAEYKVHIGIYIYKRETLLRLCSLPRTPLEKTESLEQLRALENGIRIKVVETDYRPIAVDTPDDLARAERAMIKRN
jgi:3-deoxy-manno-octulosonate cytidylyltransferase (CMP-KDO synthetase)